MPKVTGLITCNYSIKHPGVLCASRPAAAMPYLGRYRLVDFPLSNMVNCGIRTIGMVMPFNYRSIIDHVGSGKEWSLDRKNGGLFFLPGSAFGTSRAGARFLLRDLISNKVYFERSSSDYVVFSTANFVYNYDMGQLIDTHCSSGADITVLAHPSGGTDEDIVGLKIDGERVAGTYQGVSYGDTEFLDCFVVSRSLLLDMLDWYAANDYLDLFEAMSDDFGRVYVRPLFFEGYVKPVFNLKSYFAGNMDLLDPTVAAELFPEGREIKTKAHDTSPAKYEVGSRVSNSLVSAGCRIFGQVTDSVLGRSVIVESGATVRNSIVLQGCIIKSGARIENAVIDRNNLIPAGTEFRGTPEEVLVKEKGSD